MRSMSRWSAAPGRPVARWALAVSVACWTMAFAPQALAAPGADGSSGAAAKPPVSATLEGCVQAPEQAERSATFAGEMSMIAGAAKMEMRIDVLERAPAEEAFHVVDAPGLGVWRWAAPGVKSYRYLKEVTNLAAPASYRAAVRFRWVNAKGKLVKAYELRTPRCIQSLLKAGEPEPPKAG
jgi:hypothetical protein